MRFTLALLVLLSTSVCKLSAQTRWVPVYADDNVGILVDSSRVQVGLDGVYSLWSKWVYGKPNSLNDGAKYSSVTEKWLFKCNPNRAKDGTSIYYNAAGVVVFSRHVADYSLSIQEFREPIPDTVLEGFMNRFCEKVSLFLHP